MGDQTKELLRGLPSVSELLEHRTAKDWLASEPRALVVASLRSAVDTARQAILTSKMVKAPDIDDMLALAEDAMLARSLPSCRRVINATGIVLHTGLGRAPLPEAAIEAIVDGASGYCNLEFELDTGKRGRRNTHVAKQLAEITGAEAATVVNNNAAATLLILQTFAAGQEAVVSRGQLVEIGGSFRLPDIMKASGAVLREVGTTNRTRLSDYEKAIGDHTAMLLRVHTSNYRVVGFTEETTIAELAALAHRMNLLAVDDLGSGAIFDFSSFGLPAEPAVRASLGHGADLVCFSGDKLLGGPQCGVIVGAKSLIAEIEKNPLMRTYRLDKLTLLALEATLRCYVDEEFAMRNVPALAMLSAGTDTLAARAGALVDELKAILPDEEFLVCSDIAFAGGGSMPAQTFDTVVVQWRPIGTEAGAMATLLRDAEVPVIARVRDDAICFDVRTLTEDELEPLAEAVSAACWAARAAEEQRDARHADTEMGIISGA